MPEKQLGLFKGKPIAHAPLVTFPDQKVSKRTAAEHRSAQLRLAAMHAVFGHGPEGEACRACVFLISMPGNIRSYLKCSQSRISRSASTDWRAKWPACGAFKKKEEKEDGPTRKRK